MQVPELFLLFTRKLNALGVPHMISGSIASIIDRMNAALGDGWDRESLKELLKRYGLQSEWREALGFMG
jgi:hypothetical protein